MNFHKDDSARYFHPSVDFLFSVNTYFMTLRIITEWPHSGDNISG